MVLVSVICMQTNEHWHAGVQVTHTSKSSASLLCIHVVPAPKAKRGMAWPLADSFTHGTCAACGSASSGSGQRLHMHVMPGALSLDTALFQASNVASAP